MPGLRNKREKQERPTTYKREKKGKDVALDLSKYAGKSIKVKFVGGKEITGILKGYDNLLNLVLDDAEVYLKEPGDQFKLAEEPRELGRVICKGTSVILIYPSEGTKAIPNPFKNQN